MLKTITKKFLAITPAAVLLFPAVTAAQDLGNVENLIQSVGDLVNLLIPIMGGIAMLAFFYGLAKYIFQADDEEAREEGKKVMIAGVAGLFLIAAIGGIVEFIANAFDLDTGEHIETGGVEGVSVIEHFNPLS